jgi:hypothetical protein
MSALRVNSGTGGSVYAAKVSTGSASRRFWWHDEIEGPSVVCADNMNHNMMKPATIALASGFALFSTFAFASTDHHRSVVRHHRGTAGTVHPGNPDGPATFRGKDYAVPGWTDEQTQYWIDSASGPKG